MNHPRRSPSANWEPLTLPTTPAVVIWAWFFPVHAPNSIVLQVPRELWQTGVNPDELTLRLLSCAAGAETLIGWTLFGQQMPLCDETKMWLDAKLPPPPAGGDSRVVLWTQPAVAPVAAMPFAPTPQTPEAGIRAGDHQPVAPVLSPGNELRPGENPLPYFELIEFHWLNIQFVESEIRRTRGQLEQAIMKVNSLNRDLSPEENQASDSQDRLQWQDARRWLRDAVSGLSRSMKEIDVGLLSGAGQRNRFLEVLENYVKPRIPFPGLKQAAIDFEMHHKSAKNVLQAAQTAIHKGTADGERRANTVLQRITQKMRSRSIQARGKNA